MMKQDQTICYVGRRSTDICTDFNGNIRDDFFAASITCYGDNRNGNVAYNVLSGMQLCDNGEIYGARNDAIYSKFISEQCRRVAGEYPDVLFLPYSLYFSAKIPPEFKERIICCNNEQVLLNLDSKINFRRYFKELLPFPAFTIEKGQRVLEMIDKGIIPNEMEVAVQDEYSGGGEGTFIITRGNFSDEYVAGIRSLIKPNGRYVVSEYIDSLCSIGAQILVSDKEIGLYPPSIQILNGPTYIGSDLYAFSLLDESIKNECIRIATLYGEILRDMKNMRLGRSTVSSIRNRGFFGIDFIVSKAGDPPHVYVVETNPRFTGPVGLLNILCHKAGIGSVFEHAYDCCRGERTEFDDFKKIKPHGRLRHAAITRDENGQFVSLESGERNQEGLDQTVYQEDGIYSHSVFEEIKTFNVYDDRRELRKYLSRKRRSRNAKVAPIERPETPEPTTIG